MAARGRNAGEWRIGRFQLGIDIVEAEIEPDVGMKSGIQDQLGPAVARVTLRLERFSEAVFLPAGQKKKHVVLDIVEEKVAFRPYTRVDVP